MNHYTFDRQCRGNIWSEFLSTQILTVKVRTCHRTRINVGLTNWPIAVLAAQLIYATCLYRAVSWRDIIFGVWQQFTNLFDSQKSSLTDELGPLINGIVFVATSWNGNLVNKSMGFCHTQRSQYTSIGLAVCVFHIHLGRWIILWILIRCCRHNDIQHVWTTLGSRLVLPVILHSFANLTLEWKL